MSRRVVGVALLLFASAASSETPQVESAVAELLAPNQPASPLYGTAESRDLRPLVRDLGPGALPYVTAEVPRLDLDGLFQVADVLADARYRPAAGVLSARLAQLLDPRIAKAEDPILVSIAMESLCHALAAVGGPREIGLLQDVVRRPASPEARGKALAALGSIGTPDALGVVDRALAGRQTQPVRWFQPPRPRDDGSTVVATATVDGQRIDVFNESTLGAWDLWAAYHDRPGTAWLIGPIPPSFGTDVREVTGSGGVLRVTLEDGTVRTFELDAGKRDRDGDGLPDNVERRLRLDAGSHDTDGDGFEDGEDLTPNAKEAAPRTEAEATQLAVLRHFVATDEPGGGVTPAPLPMRSFPAAVKSPVLVLLPAEQDAFYEEAGAYFQGGVPPFWLEVGGEPDPEHHPAPLEDDELWFDIVYRGRFGGVVRRIEGRWYVVETHELPFE